MAKIEMTTYLEKWLHDAIERPSCTIVEPVRVVGIRQAHLGPRMDSARIECIVEPANDFEVAFELPSVEPDRENEQALLLDAAVFGFLDVVLLSGVRPYRNLRLRIIGAEFDPVSSNLNAFRLAGRHAGKEFLEAVKA